MRPGHASPGLHAGAPAGVLAIPQLAAILKVHDLTEDAPHAMAAGTQVRPGSMAPGGLPVRAPGRHASTQLTHTAAQRCLPDNARG